MRHQVFRHARPVVLYAEFKRQRDARRSVGEGGQARAVEARVAVGRPVAAPDVGKPELRHRRLDRDLRALVGDGLYERLKELSIGIFERIAAGAATNDLILADTKFEFGFDRETKDLTLIDEVGTPDSSRFWPADVYEAGHAQPSFDKQFVRDWLDRFGWNHEPPAPALPADIVAKTRECYLEAMRRLTAEASR